MSRRSTLLAVPLSVLASTAALAQGDECTGATALSLGTTPFDTTTATLSSHPWACGNTGGPDLWWTFTATNAASYTFETCGSGFDTAIQTLDAPCNAPIDLQCNDNFCGNSSWVTENLMPGESVFVRVGGANGASGTGTLTVTETIVPPAVGSTAAWLTEVANGTAPILSAADLFEPTTVDLGSPSGATGMTFEFVVYGDDTGLSTALFGNITPTIGDAAGFKFDQYPDTMQYGVTQFGVVDHTFGVPSTPGVDEHLVFVVDYAGQSTKLWKNGVQVGTAPYAPLLQGTQGVGMILRAGANNLDVMPLGRIRGVAVYDAPLGAAEIVAHHDAYFMGSLGTPYCEPAVANSTGEYAKMSASGSLVAAGNDLTLGARDLPAFSFAFFITSRMQGFVPTPGSSVGNLCLSGSIGRFVGPGQIQQSGNAGEISLMLDLTQHPTPIGFVTVVAGDTWNFQAWYRDTVGGMATSNFTSGLEIAFQ